MRQSALFPDQPPRLGVNIDHVATLRQLRGTPYPSVCDCALKAVQAGADQITVHLREDRRHIQESDVRELRKILSVPLNLEMSIAPEMTQFAEEIAPTWACLVPEKREEVTTEGGLDLHRFHSQVSECIHRLQAKKIRVSLFIEPDAAMVQLASQLKADAIEIHTGRFGIASQGSSSKDRDDAAQELKRISQSGVLARSLGLHVHAGHGIDYRNIRQLVELRDDHGAPLIEEYNIGHVLVCRAVEVGMVSAVREMKSEVLAP